MNIFSLYERQLIIYGAPGTGKSYKINESLSNLNFEVIRVVFHKDYTYADFTGCLMPDNGICGLDYVFEPGPFTIALEKALENKDNLICLLIEEMNRGNCGGIFGDIFQLLDRNDSGESTYPIMNEDIRCYLDKNTIVSSYLSLCGIGDNDIFIPPNLYIIGTMNTSDQNVFVIDSAFKRRFKMRYSPIIFDVTEPHLAKIDNLSQKTLFIGGKKWSDFAIAVNSLIDKINLTMSCIPEDKKLGPYFVDEVDVSCKQAFCDKVIYYLKNDVFKYIDTVFFDSYEEMYDNIINKNIDIFEYLREK